ncbi:hypothetical protein N7468_008843 [Penicillium chermesinum]|uniref:Uncharacterized protein n=1 Tax=Penicillium chermesinum TaxID=63820 RepID=A0A9W9NJ94_9EURO|nr:uncharacterized protein N7468_008843 [Penicillium chermesinum]KAJ5219639.1 hypothetical protein N7468_008843 [Penicillium chermesinum]KAJ6153647.1 hypothetical protein N7470_006606 [Penicillium chermesinum]
MPSTWNLSSGCLGFYKTKNPDTDITEQALPPNHARSSTRDKNSNTDPIPGTALRAASLAPPEEYQDDGEKKEAVRIVFVSYKEPPSPDGASCEAELEREETT